MPAVGGAESGRAVEEPAEARKRAAQALIRTHDAVLRRTARRFSICADDADDAYQRALEILLTKAPPINGDGLVRWMQTVTKREALAVRRHRERLLSSPGSSPESKDRDPLDSIAFEGPEPTDHAARSERVARSSEALRALKPQEVRALTLKAEGYSYAEIGEITGWTYTKINRCMAEGRKRFLQVFADIEQGRRCEQLSAALSALADGEADVEGADEIRMHLRTCGGCRAKLRAFRALPEKVLELMPIGPALGQSMGGRAHEWIGERVGTVVDKAREATYAVLSRGAGEGATHMAGSGGTRGAGMAVLGKALAICGATAAGSATCVATGVVDAGAIGLGTERERPALERSEPKEEEGDHRPDGADPQASETAAESAHDTAPPVKAPRRAEQQFGFESSNKNPTPVGGGEFGGPSEGAGTGSSAGGGAGFGFER